MMWDSRLLAHRITKVVPHVIDTVLLVSAIVMAVKTRQYPFQMSWLTAKLLALVVYIALGTIALKGGRTKTTRVSAWVAAQCVFAYIVAVAVTRKVLVVP